MHDTAVIVFLKAPEPGRVKTRLALDLDNHFILELYKGFILDLLDKVQPDYPVHVYFWPPEKEKLVRHFIPSHLPVFQQTGTDLGEKMANAFQQVFAQGFERALLIGTDIPEITLSVLGNARKKLETSDAVFGPSVDGGYYLIGFNASNFEPDVFDGIPWSTSKALFKTQVRLDEKKISWKLGEQLEDIDTIASFIRLKKRAAQNPKSIGIRTQRLLEQYEA